MAGRLDILVDVLVHKGGGGGESWSDENLRFASAAGNPLGMMIESKVFFLECCSLLGV